MQIHSNDAARKSGNTAAEPGNPVFGAFRKHHHSIPRPRKHGYTHFYLSPVDIFGEINIFCMFYCGSYSPMDAILFFTNLTDLDTFFFRKLD